MKENAAINHVIGELTVTDEDFQQTHTFALLDSDNGQFALMVRNKSTYLVKAKASNYETKKSHTIVVEVTDSGKPTMKVNKHRANEKKQ